MVGRIERLEQRLLGLAVGDVVDRCRRSFLTTSRWLSSFAWVSAGSRKPIRSDSSQRASSSALLGTVS